MKNRMTGFFLMIILCGYFFTIPVFAEETPDELKNLYARSAVLMDADSGRILFGKAENDVLPMASTTKIMTCILALENMTDGQICEVSDIAARQPKVHLGMKIGEKFYLEDLLYSLMLESHNDSAVVIAEAIAGSVEEFAVLMNQKAKEIGCEDTCFITPNGLDAENEEGIHSTTAKDLALIMRYCILQSPQKDNFIKITRQTSYEFMDITKKRSFSCHNHNAFLSMMEGAFSGKTGFTNNAGYCYVGALRQGDKTFIVALLACGWPNNKGYKWKDTKKLMEYGLENYEYQKVWKEIPDEKIIVENGVNDTEPLKEPVYVKCVVENNPDIRYLIRNDEEIKVQVIRKNTLKAPVQKGDKTGTVYYMLDENIIKKLDIVAQQSVNEKTITVYLKYIMEQTLL